MKKTPDPEKAFAVIIADLKEQLKAEILEELRAELNGTPQYTEPIPDDLPDILTPQLIADFLHISRKRVYEMMDLSPEHGGIPSFRVGRRGRRVEKSGLPPLDF